MFDEISLADAVEFIVDNRGKTVPVQDSGFPLIATNCISNENLYPEFNNVRYVSSEIYDNWFRAHPKSDDIILTNKGSKNGAICLVPDPVNFCIAQDMVALRAKKNVVYPRYLFAVLRSSLVQNRIKELNVDSVIPHFKKTDFNKLFFPLPEYEKQIEIGDNYYNLCNKIELNRQTNQTLEHIAQVLFKCWFVDFEPTRAKIIAKEKGANTAIQELAAQAIICGAITLEQLDATTQNLETTLQQTINEKLNQANQTPINAEQLKTTAALFPNALVESELGEIPEGWKVKKLKDICRVLNGRAYKNTEFKVDGTPIVRIQNLSKDGKGGKTVYSDLDLPLDKLIHKEDFVYAWSATFGPHIWRGPKSIYHYHIWKMDVDEDIVGRYFLYLSMFRKTEQMKSGATGSIFTHLTKSIMESQEILIGCNEINMFFKETLELYFNKITGLNEEIDNLKDLRDNLLPKLLSGELKVS